MSPNGSAGGCYFLPLSLPPEQRRSTSAVRVISLKPPGVPTNEVIHLITEDLANAAVHGVQGRTPCGEHVRIFIDVVGFVANYPASAGATDAIGHTGRAPCTSCTFRRNQINENPGSRFGYTTAAHSSNSVFLRQGERHKALRGANITDRDTNRLEMNPTARVSDHDCPLLFLHNTLNSVRHKIPLNDSRNLVVPGMFDPFRSNFVAPDHLLTGLTENILSAVFHCLPTEEDRMKFDISICEYLRQNGLLPQKQIFNKNTRRIHTMSLSETYCVLLVACPVATVLTSHRNEHPALYDVVCLLLSLQRVVAFTYWWPQASLDGEAAESYLHCRKEEYFSDLKELSKLYVQEVDKACTNYPFLRKHLDKPNLHMFIELYEHSIPAFGHVREFMKLVFESAHQPFKRCMTRSNNHDAHIFAVEHCVANDWKGRLASLNKEMQNSNEYVRNCVTRGIRRLLLGEDADNLDDHYHAEFIKQTNETLLRLYKPALRNQFTRDDRVANFQITKTSKWVAGSEEKISVLARNMGVNRAVLQVIIHRARLWLDASCSIVVCDEDQRSPFKLYEGAKRIRIDKEGKHVARPYKHDIIRGSNVVQVNINPEHYSKRVITPQHGNNRRAYFFAVIAVLRNDDQEPWVLCLRCKVTMNRPVIENDLSSNIFQLIMLSENVRRVAVYHICPGSHVRGRKCIIDTNNGFASHIGSVLNGEPMLFQRRVDGYPPRMA